MPKLPKLAIERLKATPQTTGTRAGSASFPGAPHPDANLLSAFVEKSLTERERTEVLNHLTQCADCREVMALASSVAPEVIQPSPVMAKRRWTAPSTLRWGALAAALGAVVIVIALHPTQEGKKSASNDVHSTIAANVNKPAPPPTVEPHPRGPELAQARPDAGFHDAAKARMKAETRPGKVSEREAGLSDAHREPVETQQQVAILATARPPAPLVTTNVRTETAEPKDSLVGGGVVGGAIPAAAPPSASLQAKTMPTPEAQAQVDMAKEVPPDHVEAAQKMSTADAARKDADTNPAGGVIATGAAGATPQMAQARAGSEGPALSRMSPRQMLTSKKGAAGAEWTISPSGKVQRSDDGRKTWEDVKVADRVTFRVISAAGRDIWAGGSAGALYHSSDGGVTWTRIAIAADGRLVAEAIVGIQSSSPLHISVTLASGQQWITEDGGQRWRSKP